MGSISRIASSPAVIAVILAATLAVQVGFATGLKELSPPREILPPAPTEMTLGAMAFGDREFLYRIEVLQLQNFGDNGGQVTPMAKYDMVEVVKWLRAMDSLDLDANHHMLLATSYFGMTQDTSKLDGLIDYIQQAVSLNPARRWRWLLNATYMAEAKRHDLPRAVELGRQLSSYDFPDMPLIARQLGSLLCKKNRDYACAGDLMAEILQRHRAELPPAEVENMEEYVAAMGRALAGQPPESVSPHPSSN